MRGVLPCFATGGLYVYIRKDHEWMLNTLLDFEQFTQRAPSPLEARVILEALNEEKKAPVSVSLSLCVCLCVCVL